MIAFSISLPLDAARCRNVFIVTPSAMAALIRSPGGSNKNPYQTARSKKIGGHLEYLCNQFIFTIESFMEILGKSCFMSLSRM